MVFCMLMVWRDSHPSKTSLKQFSPSIQNFKGCSLSVIHFAKDIPCPLPSPEAFDAEIESLLENLPVIKAFQGHLGDNPDTFLIAG
jgi:hypothetical protein